MDDPALHTWWPVRALIFPRFNAGAITRLEPLDKLEALQRLLSECLAIPAGLDGGLIEDLAQWMEGVAAFSLPFSDLDSALNAIRSCSALAGMDDVVRAADSDSVAAEGDRAPRAARSLA